MNICSSSSRRLLPVEGTENWLIKPDVKEAVIKALTVDNLYDIPITILNASIVHDSIYSDIEVNEMKSTNDLLLACFS